MPAFIPALAAGAKAVAGAATQAGRQAAVQGAKQAAKKVGQVAVQAGKHKGWTASYCWTNRFKCRRASGKSSANATAKHDESESTDGSSGKKPAVKYEQVSRWTSFGI